MIKITDGLFKGIDPIHGDIPMMVIDDLSEMYGVEQFDYMMMDSATTMSGGRARDSNGHSIKVVK